MDGEGMVPGRPGWNRLALAAVAVLSLAGLGVGIALIVDRSVEAKLSNRSAGLDRALVLGGRDSRFFPRQVAVESLRGHRPEGFELVSRAVRSGVIGSFREIWVPGLFRSKFRLNGGSKTIAFKPWVFDIRALRGNESLSKDLSELAYELYDYESGDRAFVELMSQDSANGADEYWEVTFGIPEPEEAAKWSARAEAWKTFLARHRASLRPESIRFVALVINQWEARAQAHLEPSQASLDAANEAIAAVNESRLLDLASERRDGRVED